MRTESVDEVLARIVRAARARPGGAVATDGDGTLWSGDVGEDFYSAFVERARIEPAAYEALLREAHEHAIDPSDLPPALARRIYDAYVAGRFPEERVCELMTWCFAGWSVAEVDAFAHDVAARVGLEARVHDEVRRVLDGVRREGIEIFLVSASPRAIVVAAGRLVGIDPAHVVAAEPRWESDVMLASVVRPIPYGAGKVGGLRARIGDRELYAALGDNAFDVPMLAAARVPIAVRPKPKLRARSAEVPNLVELASGD